MTAAKMTTVEQAASPLERLVLNFRAVNITPDQFLHLCSDNRDLRMELTAEGELIIMPPTWSMTGWRNSKLNQLLANWSDVEGSGLVFDSSSGFTLPNGAVRSPDAAWVPLTRWRALTDEDRIGFALICPNFVIELRSSSDRLSDLQAKMEEYLDNGARLGWLIDAQEQSVYVYRPGQEVKLLDTPESISGDSVLQGFVLDLTAICCPVSGQPPFETAPL